MLHAVCMYISGDALKLDVLLLVARNPIRMQTYSE